MWLLHLFISYFMFVHTFSEDAALVREKRYGLSDLSRCKEYKKVFECLRGCLKKGNHFAVMNVFCECTCQDLWFPGNVTRFTPVTPPGGLVAPTTRRPPLDNLGCTAVLKKVFKCQFDPKWANCTTLESFRRSGNETIPYAFSCFDYRCRRPRKCAGLPSLGKVNTTCSQGMEESVYCDTAKIDWYSPYCRC